MKTLKLRLLISATLTAILWLCGCTPAFSQTNAPPAVLSANVFAPLLRATNWSVIPYGTVTLEQKAGATTRLGGGVLSVFNVNQYVGAGLGVDWLGHFTLFSGNVTLKLPIRPFPNGSWSNLVVTPFGIAGLGTPIGGAQDRNGGLATIAGAGGALTVTKLWGGNLDVGAAFINWMDSGPYSGKSIRPFIAWRKNF